jgi:hypothetical protein
MDIDEFINLLKRMKSEGAEMVYLDGGYIECITKERQLKSNRTSITLHSEDVWLESLEETSVIYTMEEE